MKLTKGNDDEIKKEIAKQPQYYVNAVNMKVLNYKVYHMSKIEKFLYRLLAFAVGALVGYLFYGGIGKDEFGQATTITYILDILIPSVVGLIAAKFYIPMRTEQIINSRKKKLNSQFRDMLDGLSTAIGSGKNVNDSFISVNEDLKVQYAEGSFILEEMKVILAGLDNNLAIEDMLADFGERSGIVDIVSFANVFQTCYRKGGNIKDVIRSTSTILSDKMEIREELNTMISSNMLEQYIMIIMPIGLVAMMKFMMPEFAANFVSGAGLASTTVSIVMYIIAYWLSKQLLDIKI